MLRVDDIMTRDPEVLEPTHTLLDAMTLLERRKIRHIPITRGGELVGIVSDRDVKRARPTHLDEGERKNWRKVVTETPLSMVMTRDPVSVQTGASVRQVVQRFIDSRIGSLPVLEGRKLIGIVTNHDLLTTLQKLV